jgi:hypothetical protein
MTIPRKDIYRLMRTILPDDLRPESKYNYDYDKDKALKNFQWSVGEVGWSLNTIFDIDDLATLARIASGEPWEDE